MQKMPLLVFLILLVFVVEVPALESSGNAAWIDAARSKYNIPGVSVAIVEKGKPVQFYSSGFCNLELAIACNENHRLPIGSVTKSITGLLAATLEAEKRIDFDSPVVRYWPQLRLPDKRTDEITLRDLLTQQGGLGSIDWPYIWDSRLTTQDYLDRVQSTPPARPFRTGFFYANANFVLAGKILEQVTKSSWRSQVTERLLLPLGMTNSGFAPPAALTVGYGPSTAGRLEPFPYISPEAIEPAGGLVTTAKDYARLISMLLDDGKWQGKQIVPAAAVQTTLSSPGNKRGGYGLGLGFTRFREQTLFHHLGANAGYSAAVILVPGKWGAIVLTNLTASVFPEGLSFALLDRHLGNAGDDTLVKFAGPLPSASTKPITSVIALTENAASDFAGLYNHPAWGTFAVEASGQLLQIRMGDFLAPLDSASGDSFSFLSAPGWERLKVTFQRNADTKVTGLLMDDGSNPSLQSFGKLTPKADSRVFGRTAEK